MHGDVQVEARLAMDLRFDVFVPIPVPRRVRGIAEIAGDARGKWEIRDIWIEISPFGFRLAGYDERKTIRSALHAMAGSDIGRYYRGSLRIT